MTLSAPLPQLENLLATGRTDDRPGARATAMVLVPTLSAARQVLRLLAEEPVDVRVVEGDHRVAARAIEHDRPDIILAHLDSIGSSRHSVMAASRHTDSLAPVIVFSPPGRARRLVQAIDDGAIACLELPLRRSQLQQALQRGIDLHTQHLRARRRSAGAWPSPSHLRLADRSFSSALSGLHMAWQPILRAGTMEPYGFEALVRTTARDLPSAWHILDLGARLGRSAELDEHIHRRTRMELDAAVGEGVPVPGSLFINVTLRQLAEGDLGTPDDPLRDYAQRIVLELAEDTPITDVDRLAGQARRLRAAGYRIAVPELGTGRDYLASLLALQPEVFKLDRLAWARCADQPRRHRHLRAIVDMARNEGASVVCQGVETEADVAIATELGCDLLQGFLLGRPTLWTRWPDATPEQAPIATRNAS